ncbi:MAG TPA: DUF1737 domain-containing protein [Micromonosporaceae bacterium]|nr:DUF1737 domain-containing protein [Micromonosporaceae bacterium]
MTDAQLRYQVITGRDEAMFSGSVSDALKEGFVLHGPLALTRDGDRTVYVQAVARPLQGMLDMLSPEMRRMMGM